MAMSTATVHGITFTLDTMDWSDEASKEIAREALEDGLRELDEATAKRLHAELVAFSEGTRLETPAEIQAIETAARQKALSGWARHPNFGHNASIGP